MAGLITQLPAQTWSGLGGNDLFSTGANWGGSAPVSGTSTNLHFAGSTRLTPSNDQASFTYRSITFDSGASSFVVSGNAFTLNGVTAAITNSSTSLQTINNAITLGQAQTWAATSGALAFGGNVTNGGFLLTLNAANAISVSGAIGGTGGLTKSGADTLTLSGNNTYSGNTTLSAGTLTAGSDTALGSGLLLLNGGTLAASGTRNLTNTITLGGSATIGGTDALTLSGALTNSGGNRTLTISNSAATTLTDIYLSEAANNRLFTLNTAGGNVTVTGNIANGGTSTSSALTKAGAGLLTLFGNNTYGGNTTLSAGTLSAGHDNAFGTGNLVLSAGTLTATGTRNLTNAVTLSGNANIGGTDALTLSGVLTNSGGNRTLTVSNSATTTLTDINLSEGSANRTLTINTTNGDVAVTGVIANGGTSTASLLSKSGAGTLILSGNNTYAGITTVTAGTLVVGHNNALGSGLLSLTGATLSGDGTARTLANTVRLGGNATIGGTSALTFNGTLTQNNVSAILTINNSGLTNFTNIDLTNGATSRTLNLNTAGGNVTVTGVIANGGTSTASALTKSGAGLLTLSGNNTYGGATTITDGTLRLGASGVIPDASNVTLSGIGANVTATLDLAGFSETIGTLSFGGSTTTSGSAVTTGAGTLTLGGNVTYTATNNPLGATLSGKVDLGGVTRVFTVNDSGTATVDLEVGAVVSGTGAGLTKAGAGTMVLSGNNTFDGLTTISAGVLNLQHAGALGAAGNGATITSGAQLQVQGGLTITDEALTLRGAGVSNTGALRSISGNNTWTSDLTLGAASRIQTDADLLTLSGNITGNTFTLTFDGAGNTLVSGNITTTTGGLTKLGDGTLTLSGANTYTGATTINAGTLQLGADDAIANASNVTVSGTGTDVTATLDLHGNSDTIGTLTFGGSTTTNAAAVTTGAGTLTLGGNVTYTATNNPLGAIISGSLNLGAAARTFTINDSSSTTAELTINADMAGGGAAVGFTKTGAGAMILAGNNTQTGTTTVSAGSLTVNSGATLSDSAAALVVNTGGTLNLDNAAQTVSSFSGTAGTLVLGSGHTFTTNQTASTSFTGTIAGSGNFIKAGTGTLTLSGASTYTGSTTIREGALSINALGNLGDPSSALGAPTTEAAGTIAMGNGASATGLTFTGAATSNRAIDLAGTTGGVTLTANAAVSLSGNITASGAGSKTLTLSGTSTGALSGAIVDNSALNTTALSKIGNGIWTLAGNNTYSGGTTLSAGTLNLNSATALGATAGTFTIAGGTLDNTSGGAVTLTNNNAQNWNANFAFTGTQNLNLGAGAVALSGSRTVTVNAGTLTVGGDISGGGRNLIKAGAGELALTGDITTTSGSVTLNAGTLTLAGANTYTGGTVLNAGTLVLDSATALGGSSGALTINGGTLDSNTGVTLTNTNTKVIAANFTFTGTNNLNLGTGAVTLSGGARTITANASTLTIGGAIGDGGNGYGLTKAGAGTVVLGGLNTQTGTTTLSAGNLTVNSGARLAANTAGLVVNAGTLNLNNTAQTVSSLNGSGGTINLGSAHTLTVNNSGSDSFAGALGSSGNLVKSGAGNLTLSGNSGSYTGNITVGGTGTVLASANHALGGATGNITVNSGATLALDGGTLVAPVKITKDDMLTLTGTGAAGSNGALVAAGGAGTVSQYAGNITLGGNTTIGAGSNLLILGNDATFANTLSLGANTLTVTTPNAATVVPVFQPNPSFVLDAANVEIAAKITGTGGITKTGAGTLSILAGSSGGNTFTGDLTITGGKVVVASNPGQPAIGSNEILIGNAASAGGGVTSTLQAGQTSAAAGADMIGTYNVLTNASTTNLTIYADGQYSMNGGKNGFGNITLQGGLIDGGTPGTHTALTVTGGISAITSAQTAVLQNGNLLMSASNFTFDVATGGTNGIGLRIDDLVQNGVGYTAGSAGTSLVKSGLGTMVLSGANGANTYQGITSVAAGILNIQSATALGQVGSFLGDTANGTVVQTDAQLQIEKSTGLTFGTESLTLNGTGISSDGALRNVAGNNTWQGYVYLGSDSRINADSGTTLTISNPTDINADILNGLASGKNLTVGGSGNTTVNGGIAGNVNNVVKDGSGTLELAGSNGYAGATNVTEGAVKVTNSSGLSGSGVVVSANATLQFAQSTLPSTANISVGGTSATINGTGISNGGAIQNLNGSNAYAGNITLGSAASIKANSGSALTLSGSIDVSTPSHHALTIGGAGNITISGAIKNGSVTTNTSYTPNAGANTYTAITGTGSGGTLNKVDTGTLTIKGGAASTLDGITLTLGNITVEDNNTLVQAGPISSANASNVLTINSGAKVEGYYSSGTISAANTFTGQLAGSGTFQKDGAGVLVFDTTFTATNLTLLVTGGEIDFRNSAQITLGTIHFAGNTVLDFDSNTATLLSSTNVIIDAGVTVTVNGWASGTDFWLASGNFYSLNGITQTNSTHNAVLSNPESQITFADWSNLNTTWISTPSPHGSYTNNEIRPVPEPATYGALFISGCLALLGFRRYSRRASAPRA